VDNMPTLPRIMSEHEQVTRAAQRTPVQHILRVMPCHYSRATVRVLLSEVEDEGVVALKGHLRRRETREAAAQDTTRGHGKKATCVHKSVNAIEHTDTKPRHICARLCAGGRFVDDFRAAFWTNMMGAGSLDSS